MYQEVGRRAVGEATISSKLSIYLEWTSVKNLSVAHLCTERLNGAAFAANIKGLVVRERNRYRAGIIAGVKR